MFEGFLTLPRPSLPLLCRWCCLRQYRWGGYEAVWKSITKIAQANMKKRLSKRVRQACRWRKRWKLPFDQKMQMKGGRCVCTHQLLRAHHTSLVKLTTQFSFHSSGVRYCVLGEPLRGRRSRYHPGKGMQIMLGTEKCWKQPILSARVIMQIHYFKYGV